LLHQIKKCTDPANLGRYIVDFKPMPVNKLKAKLNDKSLNYLNINMITNKNYKIIGSKKVIIEL